MTDDSYSQFAELLDRTRNILWCRDIMQSLWYATCLVAAGLLLAAAVHISLVPVAAFLWVSFGLAPLLLAVLLRRRPSRARAAAALDKRGGYNDLLTTAREALAIPQGERSVGADVVLLQAMAMIQRVPDMETVSASSPWHSRYRAAPWAIMAIAIFLLQLPVQRVEVPMAGATVPGHAVGGGNQVLQQSRENRPEAQQQVSAVAGAGDYSAQSQSGATQSNNESAGRVTAPDDERLAPEVVSVPDAFPRSQALAGRGMDPSAVDDTGASNNLGNALEGGEMLQPDLQYEEIARDTSVAATKTIAGTGSVDFLTAQAQSPEQGITAGSNIVVSSGAVPYNNRFSLSQRLQIKTYFDQLKEQQ